MGWISLSTYPSSREYRSMNSIMLRTLWLCQDTGGMRKMKAGDSPSGFLLDRQGGSALGSLVYTAVSFQATIIALSPHSGAPGVMSSLLLVLTLVPPFGRLPTLALVNESLCTQTPPE